MIGTSVVGRFCWLFPLYALLCFGGMPLVAQPGGYDGQRIGLMQFDWSAKKKNILRCTAVNTGRSPISFDKDRPAGSFLLVEMDTVSLPGDLKGREPEIRAALLRQRIVLSPGQIISGLELKLAPAPEPVPPAAPVLRAPVAPRGSGPAEGPGTAPSPGPIESPTDSAWFDYSEKCPDLVLDSIWLQGETAKELVVGFIIHNTGSQAARIAFPHRKNEKENLALNIYFASGTKLTRGSLLADGMFFGQSPQNPDGLLAGGGRMGGELRISTANRTKFSPNLIVEIDPFHMVQECDETNNTRALVLPLK